MHTIMHNWHHKIAIGIICALFTTLDSAAIEPSEIDPTYSFNEPIESIIEPSSEGKLYSAPDARMRAITKKNRSPKKSARVPALKCQSVKTASDGISATPAYVCNYSKNATGKIIVKRQIKKQKIKVKKEYRTLSAKKISPAPLPIKLTPDTHNLDLNILKLRSNTTKTNLATTNNPYIPVAKIDTDSSSGHPYISIMTGASVAKIGEEQNDITGGTTYAYDKYTPANNHYSGVVAYGINGGYEFKITPKTLLSFGIGIYQNLKHTSKGKIYCISNSASQSKFDYEYNIQSTRFMAESQLAWRLDLDSKTEIIPFVLIGIGPTLNFVNNYKEIPANENIETLPGFKSNTNIRIAYQLGAGVACPLNSNNRLFVTYRFADLGRAHFGNRIGYSYQLDVGKIRTHEIYLGYTHLFDL